MNKKLKHLHSQVVRYSFKIVCKSKRFVKSKLQFEVPQKIRVKFKMLFLESNYLKILVIKNKIQPEMHLNCGINSLIPL